MDRVMRFGILAGSLLGIMASASYTVAAETFDPVEANVSCVAQDQMASSQEIDDFLANPQKLLDNNPGGGLALSNNVKSLASSSSKAYASIIALAKDASGAQSSAIGAGLARAFGDCKDSQPDYAQRVQSDVANARGSGLFVGYVGASTQPVVASVSVPAAASNAMGGGETNPDSSQKSALNGRSYGSDDPFANTTNAYDSNGAGLVGDDPSSP